MRTEVPDLDSMPSEHSSSNIKREETDVTLWGVPTADETSGTDSDGSAKDEPTVKVQDDKSTLSRQVIYLRIANFGGDCWHLIGDGSKFQVGFTTDSNHFGSFQCSTITLPNEISSYQAILKLMPAPKSPFWNASQPFTQARNQILKTVVDCILQVRHDCGYADAQNIPRWRDRDTSYCRNEPVRLPDGVEVDLAQCLSQGLQDRSLNFR